MASEIKVPNLPDHELICPTPPPSPNNEIFGFPLWPHEWFPRYKVISKFHKECSIRLEAKLSPKSKDPSISVHFTLKDHTKLLQISSGRHVSYSFDCPLIDKPFIHGYTIKASQFGPLKIKTGDYPVKREHMEFFETQIHQFIKELLESANGDIRVDAGACIESVLLPEEAVAIVKEMEGEGFREDGCSDLRCYDCAVCLEDVQMRWFKGMRLPCNHVFHVRCISRWFEKKTSCPMCRQELL